MSLKESEGSEKGLKKKRHKSRSPSAPSKSDSSGSETRKSKRKKNKKKRGRSHSVCNNMQHRKIILAHGQSSFLNIFTGSNDSFL